jgi:hypothetical protein
MINIDKLYIYVRMCVVHMDQDPCGYCIYCAQFVASQALGVCRWGAASWISSEQGMRGAIAKYREIS